MKVIQDKDTSKFNLALSEVLDSINTNVVCLEVCCAIYDLVISGLNDSQRATADVTDWLEEWYKGFVNV